MRHVIKYLDNAARVAHDQPCVALAAVPALESGAGDRYSILRSSGHPKDMARAKVWSYIHPTVKWGTDTLISGDGYILAVSNHGDLPWRFTVAKGD